MFRKFSKQQIKELILYTEKNCLIEKKDRNEMAIPTWLHSNFLIRYLFWLRYEIIYKFIKKYCSKNHDLNSLEFGCGLGLFLPALKHYSKTCYAIDLFQQYAKNLCSQQNLSVLFESDINQIQNNSLDLIIAADVLEHLEDIKSMINIFRNKLAANGRLIISGPTENILYKFGRIVAGFQNIADYHHSNIYDIENIIKKSDFTLLEDQMIPLPILPFFKIDIFQKN